MFRLYFIVSVLASSDSYVLFFFFSFTIYTRHMRIAELFVRQLNNVEEPAGRDIVGILSRSHDPVTQSSSR